MLALALSQFYVIFMTQCHGIKSSTAVEEGRRAQFVNTNRQVLIQFMIVSDSTRTREIKENSRVLQALEAYTTQRASNSSWSIWIGALHAHEIAFIFGHVFLFVYDHVFVFG